jgi:hypothetical protein
MCITCVKKCVDNCDCTTCQRTRPCECGECDVVGGSCDKCFCEDCKEYCVGSKNDKCDDCNKWSDVYHIQVGVNHLCCDVKELQHFKNVNEPLTIGTTYYMTYGGGPEGGYFEKEIIDIDTCSKTYEVYSVDRTWGTPFTATLISTKPIGKRVCDNVIQVKPILE